MQSSRQPPGKVIKESSIKAHSTLQDIRTMAEKAQIKCLVLTHFGPGDIDKEATANAIKAIYSGSIVFSEDSMETVCP